MWLFRITLLLLPLVLLGAVELALRLGGYGYNPDFFKRITIGGEDYFVQNEDFSFRFFPKETARHPDPIRFPAHKAPGTFRIFILGESAAMGDPAPAFGAYRYLEMLLREKYPDRKFEVINVAFTAINSHVILPIARECAAHEGDLWIVYMGNNEMVGPFGAATVFGRQAPPLAYVRLVTAVQRLRTGQWVMEQARKWTSHGAKPTAWGGMEMFMHNQIAPDSPLKETVYRNFQKNLDAIVRAGVGSGAKVLLNTVAVNLKDCPPFASVTDSQLSPADRAQFDQLYTNGLQAQAQSDFTGAVNLFARAGKLDARSAELQFHWGESLLAATNLAGAREHLQLACDDDALPFRTDSRINGAIRAEAGKVGGERLILFDAAGALAAGSAAGVCGQETFYEHVHFDFDGSYRLGRAWAGQIEPLLPRNANAWAAQARCEQMLGLSVWRRGAVIEQMIVRMRQQPLSGQENNARRIEQLGARLGQLHRQTTPGAAAQAREDYQKLLERWPEDYYLRENYAFFLESIGDLASATEEWRRIQGLLSHDCIGYFQAGRLLGEQKHYAEAETLLQFALTIRPDTTDPWIEFGNIQALQKKYPEALASYETALKRNPQNPQTLLRRGKVLANLNRHAEAMESYRAAARLNPTDGLAHNELGLELVAAKKFEEASIEFGEAVRLSPESAWAHFNYGALLLKQNRLAEARHEFEATLRLEPGNVRAQHYLDRMTR